MKKIVLMLALAIPMIVSAQILEVVSIQRVSTPARLDTRVAGVSPDGSYILLTTNATQGLQKFDLLTQELTVLSTAPEAGFNVRISADGKQILYRELEVGADLCCRNRLMHADLTTKKSTTIVPLTRELGGYAIVGNTVLALDKKQLRKKAIAGTQVTKDAVPVLSIQDCQLMITRGNETKVLSPNGTDESYIWPSISPDGKKICYYVVRTGCWVADIDGSNPQLISTELHDAKWYDNTTLVGMHDKDNGETFTESTIVAHTLDGKQQVLTDKNRHLAMYPFLSADGKKIAYSTGNGEVYLIHIQ